MKRTDLLVVGIIGMFLATVGGCSHPTNQMQKAWIYCSIDTAQQSLPGYKIENQLFPYGKIEFPDPIKEAVYGNNRAVIELELNRPTSVFIMPVPDSTALLTMSMEFLIRPGDSLELRTVCDTTRFRGMKIAKPELLGAKFDDSQCRDLLQQRFLSNKTPRTKAGNLALYKTELDSLYLCKQDFLDSCKNRMNLSPEYVRRTEAQFELERYNRLCSAIETNPDSELPEGYLGQIEIPDFLYGNNYYATAVLNKYVKHVIPKPEQHFEEIFTGINKAPRKLRDYVKTLAIGYFAELENPIYREQLIETIADAKRSISDTTYRSYIDKAEQLYALCGSSLPDSVLATRLKPYDDQPETTLGEVLAQSEGHAVYIDFWSSWCVGCIMDMMRSEEAKAYLSEKECTYIYLSVDEKAEAWKDAARKYHAEKNSYLVANDFKAPFCRFLELHSIPRYVLLDRRHRIVSSNAARPISLELQKLKRSMEATE